MCMFTSQRYELILIRGEGFCLEAHVGMNMISMRFLG